MEIFLHISRPSYDVPAILSIPERPEDGADHFPAVLLCHGTGSHKDEVGNLFARLAGALVHEGIASLRFDFAGCGDFIGQSPAYDGRMVVALCDQLTHLGDGILSAVVHMHCDIRNLSPYDHTVFITEIIEFLGMLVMGKTNRIGADFTDHLHVFSVFLDGQGIAELSSVLMS